MLMAPYQEELKGKINPSGWVLTRKWVQICFSLFFFFLFLLLALSAATSSSWVIRVAHYDGCVAQSAEAQQAIRTLRSGSVVRPVFSDGRTSPNSTPKLFDGILFDVKPRPFGSCHCCHGELGVGVGGGSRYVPCTCGRRERVWGHFWFGSGVFPATFVMLLCSSYLKWQQSTQSCQMLRARWQDFIWEIRTGFVFVVFCVCAVKDLSHHVAWLVFWHYFIFG